MVDENRVLSSASQFLGNPRFAVNLPVTEQDEEEVQLETPRPINLRAVNLTFQSLRLDWTQPWHERAEDWLFEIEYNAANDFRDTGKTRQVDITTVTSCEFFDELGCGKRFAYRVRSRGDSMAWSPWSETLSEVIQPEQPERPLPPVQTGGRWDSVTFKPALPAPATRGANIQGYYLYANRRFLGQVDSETDEWTIGGLENGSEVQVQVAPPSRLYHRRGSTNQNASSLHTFLLPRHNIFSL